MKILQIVPSIALVYGGPSQMVLGLSQGLAAWGEDVTVLTTDANGDAGQPPLTVPLDRPVEQDGYHIRYFRCAPFHRYKFSIDLLQWLAIHAQEFDIAHIHALFSPVSTLSATVARLQHLPYILRPLGTLDPADLQKKRRGKQLYAALFERANLAHAAAVHFTSEQEAKISERFGVITRDLVIPLGVSPFQPEPAWALSSPSETPTILFMSRLDPKKGLDLLLPALEDLLQSGLKFRFVLAGANPQDPAYEQRIRDRIQTSPLAHCTRMPGFVTGDAKAALLQAADVFVLPSYYENFGIAVAEAMAAGVPVVISDQVHIWSAIEQAQAGWISPCQIPALAHQLRLALQDVHERRRRGENAKAYATQHYSWQAIAYQTIEAYHHLLCHSS
ncbi:hormogonium polysaccharide biosynthesis glycosyltransferase HpsP [Thermocoleostomius sinensis]|uniref:hormogonium polysaccharide biosynthesis glycosyltransferase HpsP n=1 Tax=Thermocoleostomius sinensis TaxID=3065396 RepID=UPI0028F3ED83|nr:hormogonium polysaccharide biosynthesis glycosyltransferase HpsP [Thermocoleostomius sinensis]